MKKLLMAAMLVSLSSISYGACNPNNNGGTCNDPNATGSQGPAGIDGTNGTNGANGAVGPAANTRAEMLAGLELRLFDTRYVSLFAFDNFGLDPVKSHSIIGGGAKNSSYGAKLVIKLGRDYTEAKIAALEKRIRSLEAR